MSTKDPITKSITLIISHCTSKLSAAPVLAGFVGAVPTAVRVPLSVPLLTRVTVAPSVAALETPAVPTTRTVLPAVLVVKIYVVPDAVTVPPAVSVFPSMMN